MTKRLAAVGAAALTLALAPAAHAAKAFTVGTGYAPDVSVDTSGAANVAWIDATADGSGSHPVHYCKVGAGGSVCALSKVLTAPEDTIGTGTVRVFTPSANRVLIVVYRCCGNPVEGDYVFESTDGGANFGAPVQIGTIEPEGEAIFANEAVYGVTLGGAVFQRMPITGPAPGTRAELDAGFPVPTYAGVGLVNGTTPIKVSADG